MMNETTWREAAKKMFPWFDINDFPEHLRVLGPLILYDFRTLLVLETPERALEIYKEEEKVSPLWWDKADFSEHFSEEEKLFFDELFDYVEENYEDVRGS